jgi:hypothetical protein
MEAGGTGQTSRQAGRPDGARQRQADSHGNRECSEVDLDGRAAVRRRVRVILHDVERKPVGGSTTKMYCDVIVVLVKPRRRRCDSVEQGKARRTGWPMRLMSPALLRLLDEGRRSPAAIVPRLLAFVARRTVPDLRMLRSLSRLIWISSFVVASPRRAATCRTGRKPGSCRARQPHWRSARAGRCLCGAGFRHGRRAHKGRVCQEERVG